MTNICNVSYGTCTNTDGSFECSCQPGFMGDGIFCDGTKSDALVGTIITENILYIIIYCIYYILISADTIEHD